MPPPDSPAKRLIGKALWISLLVALCMAMAGIGAYVALTLIIQGEEPVIVPDLVGKDVLYGLEILADLGLNTRVKGTAYHDRVPKNHVIDQDPDAGTAIKRGRDVKIRVSRGPETIIMPNLSGLSLQQSRIVLTENGLCLGTVANMINARFAAGQVMAQNPPSSKVVAHDTCADLLVSRGPFSPAFPMADLTGLRLETAIKRLEQLQLTLGNIRVIDTAGRPLETIVDQMPLAGHRVITGSHVNLTVNRSRTGQPTDNPATTDQVELFRFSLENGFLKKRVQVKMTQTRFPRNLFDDFLAPGQEIWLLVPNGDNPTVLVYVDGQLVDTRIMDGR